jgi:hypothetical protein
LGRERLEILEPALLTQMLFGFTADDRAQKKLLQQMLENQPGLQNLFKEALPIPLPYAGNLNYI